MAQMMADLGLARRDIVSAPNADSRGRIVREDPHQQAALLADVEARRARHNTKGGADGDERGARLRAWNSTWSRV